MTFKVDMHTHILPETWPDYNKRFGYEGYITLEHHREGFAATGLSVREARGLHALEH